MTDEEIEREDEEIETLDFDKDELREPCNVCNNYDRWEIYK